jgi:hypothetical protein
VNVPGAFYQLWFAVRYVHVVAAATLIGGATLVALIAVASGRDACATGWLPELAVAYEWVFWTVMTTSVVTGISNLGLKGDGLLPPATQWGRALTVKLASGLVVLMFSAMRTDVVLRCRDVSTAGERVRRMFASLYAATASALLTILWVGLGLAHGRY